MTGTQNSAIDFEWLLANLEVGEVEYGVDDVIVGKVQTFVLKPKALYAAEAFVLGLFQLYPTVYFHKATRGAEKIYTELLVRLIQIIRDGSVENTGLPTNHPIVKFAMSPDDVEGALALDDSVVWGSLCLTSEAKDDCVSQLATRLRDRKLFKCVDIRSCIAHEKGDLEAYSAKADKVCESAKQKLNEWTEAHSSDVPRILIDEEKRSPYKRITESKGPLDQINIKTDGGFLVDLSQRSKVVSELETFRLLRAYAAEEDTEARSAITAITAIITSEMTAWPQ